MLIGAVHIQLNILHAVNLFLIIFLKDVNVLPLLYFIYNWRCFTSSLDWNSACNTIRWTEWLDGVVAVRSSDRFISLEWDGFTVITLTRTISGGIFYIKQVWAGGNFWYWQNKHILIKVTYNYNIPRCWKWIMEIN